MAASAFSRIVNLFSFLYTMVWFELKSVAKCLCEDPNVIFCSNLLVVYSLPPAMSCAQMRYKAFNQTWPRVSPSKRFFWSGKKLIGENLRERRWGLFYMDGLMINHAREDSLTNAFSSNENTVNMNVLPKYKAIYTCRLSPNQSMKLWKDLHLRLAVMRFQRSYYVQFSLC